jgi:hypothetical protein
MADLSTGDSLSDTPLHATALAQEAKRSIRSMHMARRAAAKLRVVSWTAAGYRQAVDQSSLKTPVKNTLHAMVDNSAGNRTTIDRASLCLLTGTRDESTVTEHFKKARGAGLLKSEARFNKSSLHTLLIPGTESSADDVQWGRPMKNAHSWTPEEIRWWDSLEPGHWTTPPWEPWQGQEPPF